jgi:ankyrin repeat protein
MDINESLLVAADEGNLRNLRYCLNRGAELDHQDDYGRTALFLACYQGHLGAVQLLLQEDTAGGDDPVEIPDEEGNLPLTMACMANGPPEIIRLLYEQYPEGLVEPNEKGKTALFYACLHYQEVAVKFFLDQDDSNLEYKDNLGHTVLFDASCDDIAKLLLNRGADMESQADNGDTPLAWACKMGRTSVVKVLLDQGANMQHQNHDGTTPLHFASEKGKTRMVQLMLDRGCHVDLCDSHGSTPLLVACRNGHWRLVGLLLDRGANLEHRDNSNWTALALASVAGHADTVRILMERGAGEHLAVQWETSKGSRLVTPTMAGSGGLGGTGASSTNSKNDSADNNMNTQRKRKRQMKQQTLLSWRNNTQCSS